MGIVSDYLTPNEYKYYDTPEGEDCFKKLWFMTKYAGIYGLLGASLDVLLFSHPKGYAQTIARYTYMTVPVVGAAAAFAATTCMATNLRHKDDKFNYALGGAVSGAVFGAWRKNMKVGVFTAMGLAFLAVLKKDSVENNWSMLGNQDKQRFGSLHSAHRDFSIVRDPGRA